jgi:hypothetical protein
VTTSSPSSPRTPRRSLPAGWADAWARFWFAPVAPVGLHWVRFLAGLLFLSWLLPLTGERAALFGPDGWVDRQAYLEARRLGDAVPVPLNWSLIYPGWDNPALFDAIWWGSIAVLVLFTIGAATRVTVPLTWVIVVSFLASPASHADTDYLLGIVAFYLAIGYVLLGQWNRPLTPLERIFGARDTSIPGALLDKGGPPAPSYAANFALRLLQVHFAIIVATSALHKLQYGDWWAGVAYWYPLHPALTTDAARIQAERPSRDSMLFLLSLTGYVALAWQLTFPLFAFRRRWRPLLLTGALVAWAGTMYLYGDMTFGALYALGCLSYLDADEWAWLTKHLRRPLERRAAVEAPAEPKPRVRASI